MSSAKAIASSIPGTEVMIMGAQVGMQFQAGNDEGRYIVTVAAVEGDLVTVDANHPLAGVELHFSVEVVEVREATADEIAHGHVHGPGGAH